MLGLARVKPVRIKNTTFVGEELRGQ